MIVLETARLVLRRLTPADAPFILELLNDPDWLRYIGDRGVRTVAQAADYITAGPMQMYARHGFGLYLTALKADGAPIGLCGLIRRDFLDDVDIGFAFLPGYRGAGYAREAADAVLDYAGSVLGLGRLVAIVDPANDRSARLLEQIGLRFERMVAFPGEEMQLRLFAIALPGPSSIAPGKEQPTTFASRPPALPADLPLIVDLSARAEAIDQTDFPSSAPALEGTLGRPGVDQQHDLRLWHDSDGQPVAFALLDRRQDDRQIDGILWMRVLPERRTPELDRALIDWGAERLRQVGAERGLPTRLAVGAGGADQRRIALLAEQGFSPIRYFLRMERPLGEPPPPPQLPPGYTLRPVAGDQEAEAWAELFNLSFVDHWNFHPLSVEQLRGIWREPLYSRELDLVLAAPDGVLAAFCACELNPDDAERAGWIEVLGTRRGYRGMGLGRAILLGGLGVLQRAGARVARLTVDAESPTGATRLYEAAGFRETRRSVRMARPLEAAG